MALKIHTYSSAPYLLTTTLVSRYCLFTPNQNCSNVIKTGETSTHTSESSSVPPQEEKNTICLHTRMTQKAKSFPQEKKINLCLSSYNGSAFDCYLIENDVGSPSFPWNLTSLHAVLSIITQPSW